MSVIIKVSASLLGSDSGPEFITEDNVSSYSHTIQALGGYWDAKIGIADTILVAEDWLYYGLGRHVVTKSPSLVTKWEGFVNQISIQIGAYAITVGPLVDVCNRVHARYSDFTTGAAYVTATAEDAGSQERYGIHYKVLDVGQCSSVTADKVRDTYLEENRYPKLGQGIAGSGDIKIDIECLGYVHLLNFPYSNALTSTYTLREKLIDVMDSEPNTIFSTNYGDMATNTLSVYKTESDNKLGWDIIKELISMGAQTTNDRMLFGIYADRKAKYEQVPSTIEYSRNVLEDSGVFLNNAELDPWDVLPGKWLKITDVLVGHATRTSYHDNPNIMFVESVNFTAPNQISLTGGNAESLSQQLAKLGLAGI